MIMGILVGAETLEPNITPKSLEGRAFYFILLIMKVLYLVEVVVSVWE
jgi:hypothetical protein